MELPALSEDTVDPDSVEAQLAADCSSLLTVPAVPLQETSIVYEWDKWTVWTYLAYSLVSFVLYIIQNCLCVGGYFFFFLSNVGYLFIIISSSIDSAFVCIAS